MKALRNHGSSLKLVTVRKAKWKILSASIMVSLMIFLNISTARALEIVVADGYVLELVASGEIQPMHIAFDRKCKNLYVFYSSGRIAVLDVHTGSYGDDVVPANSFEGATGIAVHPKTGKLYVSSRYLVDPAGATTGEAGALNVKCRIDCVDPDTGIITPFVEGLPSMWFGGSIGTATQGMDFDSYGNLYVAQSLNDAVREAGGDPNHSSILKIDKDGNVYVFCSGVRAPYDVVVAKEGKHGKATILYGGDNGDGVPDMYYDELNRYIEGKHYGWVEQLGPPDSGSHIGPLWNFDKVPPDFVGVFFSVWNVPTGIDILHGKWGKGVKDPLFLAQIRLSFFAADQGVIEMFTGIDYSDRMTLAKYIDGPIDVRIGHCKGKKLYFAEYQTGDIYSIAPAK